MSTLAVEEGGATSQQMEGETQEGGHSVERKLSREEVDRQIRLAKRAHTNVKKRLEEEVRWGKVQACTQCQELHVLSFNSQSTSSEILLGTVSSWVTNRAFGFVVRDGDETREEFFFHKKNIARSKGGRVPNPKKG